jgi:hypothetical protein
MPVALTHAGQAVDGGAVYIAGGFVGNHPGGSTAGVWHYDTLGDSWTAAPDLPADRGGGALVRLGRTLHFFGGATRTAGINVLTDFGDHWTLDLGPTDAPADDAAAWESAAPLPNARNHLGGRLLAGSSTRSAVNAAESCCEPSVLSSVVAVPPEHADQGCRVGPTCNTCSTGGSC